MSADLRCEACCTREVWRWRSESNRERWSTRSETVSAKPVPFLPHSRQPLFRPARVRGCPIPPRSDAGRSWRLCRRPVSLPSRWSTSTNSWRRSPQPLSDSPRQTLRPSTATRTHTDRRCAEAYRRRCVRRIGPAWWERLPWRCLPPRLRLPLQWPGARSDTADDTVGSPPDNTPSTWQPAGTSTSTYQHYSILTVTDRSIQGAPKK